MDVKNEVIDDSNTLNLVFSIDVEDWFQVENLKGRIDVADWDQKELRVERSTRKVLELLRRHDIRATFFVLGWVAERCPDLVRDIADGGHEIASHGYGHELLHELDEQQLRDDIERSLEILSPLSTGAITGYRAPSFSITAKAADVLKELGLGYDASYNRFQFNSRYGEVTVEENDGITRLANGLREFPVTVNNYFGVQWPLGGGYFRLSPMWFLSRQFRDIAGSPVASVYLHPWEFDPEQPRVDGLRASHRFRHYYGLAENAHKLDRFLALARADRNTRITTFADLAA